jgi:lipopolysaccharide assembly outer membrane protein LptD (OstA)
LAIGQTEIRSNLIMMAFCLILLSVSAFSQEESGPLILEHADQLISTGANGEVVNLIGNVHFTHENADLYSQRATWYRTPGLVQFIDSVLVKDDDRKITARTVTYYRLDRKITAKDNVEVIDTKQDIILDAQNLDYYRALKRIEATGHPHLIINHDIDSSRMDITALRLVYLADQGQGTAYDSVTINRRDMIATSGETDFFKNPEKAILIKNPEIDQGGNRLTGDTISIFTDNKKIQSLLVRGNARADYLIQPDTTLKQFSTATLTGKELEAFFANDRIDRIVTRHNAVSNYAPAATDTLVHGTNTASGDSITIFFEQGNIRRVLVSGGAIGEFVEPKVSAEGKTSTDTTHYSADVIDYSMDDATIKLLNNGSLHYHDMALSAGDIRYNVNTRILLAVGVEGDTSGQKKEQPVLKQGTEELNGERMTYNLLTKKGQVRMARTNYEGGYYNGQKLRQVSEDVIFVSQGNYSSCDKEEPHYHFHSIKMKLIAKDKIIAKPVIMYIGQLPIFAIPYYVFPIRKGRHSGFLPFEIGNFERGQRFIRNVGYYWAASQYWDLESSFDFYEASRTILNSAVRYASRYSLTGSVGINYSRETSWTPNYTQSVSNRWRLQFSHDQTITPTVRLSGSGMFISDKNFIADNIFDPTQRLDRSLHSNLNLSKRWQSSSLVINGDQTWNLDTDNKRELLPSINFSRPSFAIFPGPAETKKKERIKPKEKIEEPKKRFYNSIYLSFNVNGQNLRNRFKNADSTFSRRDFQTIFTQGSLSSPQKILGFLTVTPATNFSETIYRLNSNSYIDTLGDSLGIRANKIATRATYNFGVGTNTSLYGTVYPKILGLTGLRHVMRPSVSYTYTPKLIKNQGYIAYTGVGVNSTKAKAMAFSLGDLFQAKYKSGDNEKKLDLFSLDFSSGYNFTSTTKKLGDLTTSLRTSTIPKIDFSFNMVHTFYNSSYQILSAPAIPFLPTDSAFAKTIIPISRRPLLQPKLVSMSITTSFKGGYHPGSKEKKEEQPQQNQSQKSMFGGSAQNKSMEYSDVGIDFTVSHFYSESKSFGSIKTQWIEFSTQFQPTKNWKFSYTCHYNMIKKQIDSQSMNIGRDMHCWEGTFTWIPSGVIAGYYVRISIKSIPDIKLEKSEGNVGRNYL